MTSASSSAGVAIELDNVSKIFRLYASPWDRFREAVTRRPRHRAFHALRDVSFRLAASEGIGIIGENGAGKSTLLRIAAGVSRPTTGRVAVGGKIASVLELGTGFHSDFTGRQNIRLNAAALGLRSDEVREKTGDIIAFSELGDFIDEPIKRYSTGMRMRLAFSIATQIEPDVLIVDEALSVGDGYFQKKCTDQILQFIGAGGTLFFCSHAMYYVTRFCEKALWLKEGRVARFGASVDVVREYETYLQEKRGAAREARPERGDGVGVGPARLTAVRVPRAGGGDGRSFRRGDTLEVELEWKSEDVSLGFHLAVGLNRVDGVQIAAFATHRDGVGPFRGASSYRVRLRVPGLDLIQGRFSLHIYLLDEAGLYAYDSRVLAEVIEIESARYEVGLVELPHEWEKE